MTYEQVDPPLVPHHALLNYYLRFLFRAERFRVTHDLCEVCGLVFANPTFTEDQLRRIYTEDPTDAMDRSREELLAAGLSDPSPTSVEIADSNTRRSRWTFLCVRRQLDTDPQTWRVLDFGGKDGALLAAFVESGARAFLHDLKPPDDLPDQVEFLPDPVPEGPFHVIVLSHALEHVVEPRRLLERLRDLLARDGLLYVEVPCAVDSGICCGDPGPPTHINLFGPGSLSGTIHRAGLGPLRPRLVLSSYRGLPLLSLACVARRDASRRRPPPRRGSMHLAVETGLLRLQRRLFAWNIPGLARM